MMFIKIKMFLVGLLFPTLLSSQDIEIPLSQGYMLLDDKLTVYTDVNTSVTITQDSVFLPYRRLKINSAIATELEGSPVMQYQLSDNSVLTHGFDMQHGALIGVTYGNGRWVMWEIGGQAFDINLKKN